MNIFYYSTFIHGVHRLLSHIVLFMDNCTRYHKSCFPFMCKIQKCVFKKADTSKEKYNFLYDITTSKPLML